eukprot:m51a1_g7795 hypothetical protein (736) ;mRNA; f:36344-38888
MSVARADAVLVANRGEIACRVMRTARAAGLRSVGVATDGDAGSLHARRCDSLVRLGPSPRAYLDARCLAQAAARSGAQLLHPGCGFLSESAHLARACAAEGVVFVGPSPEALDALGDKRAAREAAARAGAPVTPGFAVAGDAVEVGREMARRGMEFPVLVKAALGGGGRGMRVASGPGELPEALRAAAAEALGAFGDAALLVEAFHPHARHVEVQIFGDRHGNVVTVGDRDCSLQRRHQKLAEESPAPLLSPAVRRAMHRAARDVALATSYAGAGTVEFLVPTAGPDGPPGAAFAFLEVNARLQVEHSVTEAAHGGAGGLDLVAWQLAVACGSRLPLDQGRVDALADRHAFEARLYAEDPARGFAPSAGTLAALRLPTEQPGRLRVDAGAEEGDAVGADYDGLLAKLVASGPTRAAALGRLVDALARVRVAGVATNAAFLARALGSERVRRAPACTRWLDSPEASALLADPPRGEDDDLCMAAALCGAEAAQRAGAGLADPWRSLVCWRPSGPREEPLRWSYGPGARRSARAAWSGGGDAPLRCALSVPSRPPALVELCGPPSSSSLDLRVGGEVFPGSLVARDGRGAVHAFVGARHVRADVLPRYDEAAEGAGAGGAGAGAAGGVASAGSPTPGRVARVLVAPGQRVERGQTVALVEAMKMEHRVVAPEAGVVVEVLCEPGAAVAESQPVCRIRALPAAPEADADPAPPAPQQQQQQQQEQEQQQQQQEQQRAN